MTKTLSIVSHKNYNLGANEGFVIFSTSKLSACFIDRFTFKRKMKSQSIAYLLNGSEQIYWILDLENEMHSIWDLWISELQQCKDNGLFEVRWACISFRPCLNNLPPPKSLWGGGLFNVRCKLKAKSTKMLITCCPQQCSRSFWA